MIEQADRAGSTTLSPHPCLICRRRKIKCDRTLDSCLRCRNFREPCVYSTEGNAIAAAATISVNGDTVTRAGLKRRRVLRSCNRCKRTKAKCSGEVVCERCRSKGIECRYDGSEFRGETPGATQGSDYIPGQVCLTSQSLPPIDQIRELVDIYFARIHTVRCLGFLHIPSFMERLRHESNVNSDYSSGLIHIICALAAPFKFAEQLPAGRDSASVRYFSSVGEAWAQVAMNQVMSSLGSAGAEMLMVEILLHEFYLRVGDYARAFLITGLISRHVQVLQLNIECDYDIMCTKGGVACAVKETRRRLVWSCFLLDAFIECGIDQLRFISAEDIQVQLPCCEELFMRGTPCVTEVLASGKLLPFVDADLGHGAASNLDMRAFYIRIMAIRSKILKYVKHLENEVPWDDDSQFRKLDDALKNIEASIPDTFRMTPENTYIFKASGRLTMYFGLHVLLSQSFNDLYRVGVPYLVFPNTATQWIRDNAPKQFIRQCYDMCMSRATNIAKLLKTQFQTQKLSVVDIPYIVHVQVCSSVLVTCLSTWAGQDPLMPHLSFHDYRSILETNVDILKYLQKFIKADLYYESSVQALKRLNMLFSRQVNELGNGSSTDRAGYPPQYSLEFILSPLGTYPLARNQIFDRHKPESSEESSGTSTEAAATAATPASAQEPATTGYASNQELFFGYAWDAASENAMMEGIGYPTFLDFYPQSEHPVAPVNGS